MLETLRHLLEGDHQAGLDELRQSLCDLFGERAASWRLIEQQKLQSRHSRATRLRFESDCDGRSVVVKRLAAPIAHRNQLVLRRWLPAVGLDYAGPALLAVAASRNGECVWHVYEDLGDCDLNGNAADRERITAAAELIAQIHTRFAVSPLLPECRLYGGDLGIDFFNASVRDAIRSLDLAASAATSFPPEHEASRKRLQARLRCLLAEQPKRADAVRELGGPETLLHGDLWTTNTFVARSPAGVEARLIDWDHTGVGPFSYDLSTFLLRFPMEDRPWILDVYRAAMATAGWNIPTVNELNLLFETAECARLANIAIWPATSLATGPTEWAFDLLDDIEKWFDQMQPVVPAAAFPSGVTP